LTAEQFLEKYQEAQIAREFEVGVFQEAIVRALGGGK
jgi:hypothetical protein